MTLAAAYAATPAAVALRPFVRVEVHADVEAVAGDWADLGPTGSGYQAPAFVAAWARAMEAKLRVVVARDACGRAVALLPLHLARVGPLTAARFAGEAWANYQMGLFRPGAEWREADVRALLAAAGHEAGADFFAFTRQPARWEGTDNPLAPLFGGLSPSPAFATPLGADPQVWLDAHFSRATQKKLRKKLRKLDALGEVRFVRAAEAAEAARFLDALFAHKAGLAAARGEPDPFADARVRDFLRLSIETGAMEMHALVAGERIAAAFGAVRAERRLSGVMVSYDGAPEVAAATPGESLLIEVVNAARARGFATFDLGVGESRYKSELCEVEERLHDTAFGVTLPGRVAARLWLAARAVMREIKRRPALLAKAQGLRRVLKA